MNHTLSLHKSVLERSFSSPDFWRSDPEEPFRNLDSSDYSSGQPRSKDDADGTPSQGPLRDLMGRIVITYHTHEHNKLLYLRILAKEVSAIFGKHHPKLIRVAALVADLETELQTHMMREENGLFQCIARMENAVEHGIPLYSATVDTLTNPVKSMLHEHDRAMDLMEKLHALTDGFHPPGDASAKQKELYASLADLERILQQHLLMENEVLFPRALALEAQLR